MARLAALPDELVLLIMRHALGTAADAGVRTIGRLQRCSKGLAALADIAAQRAILERGMRLEWWRGGGARARPLRALENARHGAVVINDAGSFNGVYVVDSFGCEEMRESCGRRRECIVQTSTPTRAARAGAAGAASPHLKPIWRHVHRDHMRIMYYSPTRQWCLYVETSPIYSATFRLASGRSQVYGGTPLQAHSWQAVHPDAGAAPRSRPLSPPATALLH